MLAYAIRNAIVAFADRKGVTAAEYAVLAAAMVVAIAAALAAIGPKMSGIFTDISNALGT